MLSAAIDMWPKVAGENRAVEIPRWHSFERCLLLIGLLLFVGALSFNVYSCSPTVDEPGHLAAGVSYWRLGQFHLYRVNPPLIRLIAAVPAVIDAAPSETVTLYATWERKPTLRRNISLGYDFFAENRDAAFRWLIWGRLCCIPLCALGAWACWRWGNDLFGRPSGLVAFLLWITSPLILGHGCLITSDVAGAALGVSATYLFWRWLQVDSIGRLLSAGTMLGFAMSAKTTWIVALILWPLLLLTHFGREATKRRILRLGLLLGVAVYVVNCLYGFEDTALSLGEFDFVSRHLRGAARLGESGNVFHETWLSWLPVPFPKNFVSGIDLQLADFERSWPCYLAGEWRQRGWWYFYVVGLFAKHPLGLAVITLLCVGWQFQLAARDRVVGRMPWILAAALLILVSSKTGWTQHVRYAMPVLPFWYVWVSQIARPLVDGTCRNWQRVVIAVSLIGYVVESAAAFPHSLAFFNLAIGGPSRGASLLVDSNQDWGQDLGRLKEWLDKHPEAKPIRLAYFGGVDPNLVGIEFSPASCPLEPGWYAVSTTLLHGGAFHAFDGKGGTRWLSGRSLSCLKQLQPVARIGETIHVIRSPSFCRELPSRR